MPFKDKVKFAQYLKGRSLRIKKLIRKLKALPCHDCGISYPYFVMDFDHRENKTFDLSTAARRQMSEHRILMEAAKCDVVCANCHRQRTFKHLTS